MKKVDKLILEKALNAAVSWLDDEMKAHTNLESEYNKLMDDDKYDDDYKQDVQLIRMALGK